MSSSLTVFACIENIDRVISCLYQLDDEEAIGKKRESGNWNIENDQWTWGNEDEGDSKKVVEEEKADSDDKDIQKNWLQDCYIAISPCEDLIAFGLDDKLVILTAKWDRQATSEPKTKFEISWTGQLALEEGECISSLLCLPLASQHKSSQGFPDWTCIVAGFTSGFIRFYLQDGSLLLYQLLHEDPVLKLKCQTWQPDVSHTDFEQVEELAILYPTALVLLDGFSLYQSMRGCRNQLARAQASGTGEGIKAPPLEYKKWNLKGQRNILDIASCGVVTPSLFDQLQTASFSGGCDASIRVTPPTMAQYVTSGSDPFVAVYSAVEGESPPLISEVALEVATKLTTAVLSKLSVASGWLGWGASKREPNQSQNTSKGKPKVEKGVSLPLRYSITDQRRDGTSITLSPDKRLAATTDEFGRVMLISVKQGIILRTWKGYRDAECGWIPVQEEHPDIEKTNQSSEPARRTALFLIIYAPRRGILEVWTTEYGPRAAAFNVGRDCSFLYTGHHILGLSHVMSQTSENNGNPVRCVLLQPNGNIRNLTVPFHCALSDKFSRRVRDLHLLKKLSAVLDHAKEEEALKGRALEKLETTVLDILTSIQVPVLFQQGLQCVLSTVGLPVSLLEKAVNSVSQSILKKANVSDDHEHEDESDVQALVEFTKVQEQVIQMYNTLRQEKNKVKEAQDQSGLKDEDDKIQWFATLLSLTGSEATTLLNSIEKYWKLTGVLCNVKDKSSDLAEITITNFLSCFDMVTGAGRKNQTNATTSSEKFSLRVRLNLSSETLAKLGNFVYKDTFCGFLSPEKLCLILDSSNIHPTDLLDILMFYWLSVSTNQAMAHPFAISTLYSLVSSISSMTGVANNHADVADSECSGLTAWWEKLRHELADSTVTSQTLAAAVCCRSVVLAKQIAAKKLEDGSQDMKEAADWVSVSLEMERWNLLVNQIDDVLNLSMFGLSLEITSQTRSGKVGELSTKWSEFLPTLSVLNILGRGQSGIAEIIAKCVVRHDTEPRCLGYPCLTRNQRRRSTEDDDRPEEVVEEPDPSQLLEGLLELRKHFPYSLAQDVLWAHCSYEYVNQWLGNKQLSGFLQKALEHVKCIGDQRLKHGLCVLMWRKVKDSVSAMTMLTEKVGKAPKERLCIKTVQMGSSSLTIFLKSTRSILQFLAEMSHINCDEAARGTQLTFEVEDFWQTGDMLPTSFLDEAMETDSSNEELVAVHYWLVSLLWLIMGLGMKSVKPLSLMSSKEKKILFKQLSTVYECGDVEPGVSEERETFFPKALSAVVHLLSTAASPPMNEHEVRQAADDWSTAIYDLAGQVAVDTDPLKSNFVCELCSAGMDKRAQEAFLTVRDKATLCSKLLKIVGQRLAENIFDYRDPSETARILSSLPVPVSSWIRKQEPSKLRKKGARLSDMNELMTLILNGLSDDAKEHDIATSLVDILKTLS